MNVAAKLREARALIERGWCQGSMGLDKNGYRVPYDDADVASVCAYGAMCLAGVRNNDVADDILEQTARHRGFRGYIAFNDHKDRTKAEVLALFDEAIALAEAS